MKTSTILRSVAGAVALLFGGSIYFSKRQQKRDKLATELLRKLSPELNVEAEGLLAEDAFNIHFKEEVRKKVKGRFFVLKTNVAAAAAREIYESWSWWNDDENRVYNVFRLLKDKVAVSQVALAYSVNYNENLIDTLSERLDEDELKIIRDIVRKLPAYRKG